MTLTGRTELYDPGAADTSTYAADLFEHAPIYDNTPFTLGPRRTERTM